MKYAALITLLLLAPVSQETENVLVGLEDGSRFAADPGSDPLLIKTEYGELKIPFSDLVTLDRGAKGEHVVRTRKLKITGRISQKEFTFKTSFGEIRIPAGDVKHVRLGKGQAFFSDEKTVAFWSFDEAAGKSVADLVSGRALRLHDAQVVRQPEGFGAFRRNGDGSFAQARMANVQIGQGPFTLEIRAKVGAAKRSYTTLIAKNKEGSTHDRDFWLLVQRGGNLYLDSGTRVSTNFVAQTPGRSVNLQKWVYIAVVWEPKAQQLRFYVDGKRVHTHKGALNFNQSDGDLFIGPGTSGKSYFSAPEAVQFVRVSKSARTDGEISEVQSVLDQGGSVGGAAPERGVMLRDGGYLRSGLKSMAGLKFKTKYGTLELQKDTRGELRIYRFREKDIEEVRIRVADLVDRLSAASIVEREDAMEELVKIGAPAASQLRKARKTDDAEARSRVDEILKKFEDSGELNRPVNDVLTVGRTKIHGWLTTDTIRIGTTYGEFDVDIRKVRAIPLGKAEVKRRTGPVLVLRTGERVSGDFSKASIPLETDFGTLEIPLKDVRRLKYDEKKGSWSVETDKAVITGTVKGDRLDLETPAGNLSVPLSAIGEIDER